MTARSARGARVRGALSVLSLLEEEGRSVTVEGEGLSIRPAKGLQSGDLHIIKNLKPELVALAWFTVEQRGILATDQSLNLEDLRRYRMGLEYWLRFTPEEQSRMIGLPWTPEDLRAVADLRKECDGEVFQCEDPPRNKEGHPMAG